MPIYEYRCNACGFEKDALQKMSDPPLVDCPSCGKPALVKLVSAAGFQLKGSGWYATDFKSSGKSATGKSDAAAESGSADSAGLKTAASQSETKSGDDKASAGAPSSGSTGGASKPAATGARD